MANRGKAGRIFIVLFLLLNHFAQAQTEVEVKRFENNAGLRFHLNVPKTLNITQLLTPDFVTTYFELSRPYRYQKHNTLTDALGQRHVRYKLFYNNIEILGSNVVAHFKDGLLYSINGVLFKVTNEESRFTKDYARQRVLMYTGATLYSWQLPEEEAMLKIWKSDSLATYYPTGNLVYCPKNMDFNTELKLCYSFEINAIEPLMRKQIYVNATTGEIWAEENLIHVADVKGSANTKYRGDRDIVTDSVAPGSYRLRESGRGGGIETYNMKKGTSYSAAVDFTDTDNYWNNYNVNQDEVAGDAHFGAEMTYDYYWGKFNRNSFDGNGAKIRSYVHYRSNYVNAFWNGSVMTYGDGKSAYSPLTSLDICGHEVSHAVTTSSAGLIYSYESGALNESFSDIFGNSIEYYADSTQFSWRMGEDIMVNGNGLRNMANPNTHLDPDTYKGKHWYGGFGDNGGVHTNSGVQNFWYYLLCEGGTGTNDNNDTYAVDSLGMSKAEQIAYRNLTVYLTPTSQYADARYYAIQSAADLYGQCSKEVEATTNAWYAVGVGDAYDSSSINVDFQADTHFCQATQIVQFANKSSNTRSYLWKFGDGDTSTAANPSHVYPGQGFYSVKLIAEGCYKGVKDSVEKVNYIEIDSTWDICSGYLLSRKSWGRVQACSGFIYDHGGEGDYEGLHRDTLTIEFGISDSAYITFLEFDYEDGYDSVYVYDGLDTKGLPLGGYTGQNLPNGGKLMKSTQGGITITHFSDPLKVGTGFKASFQAYRKPISLVVTPDTTVCYGQKILLTALGSGGSSPDHVYSWNGVRGGKALSFTATQDTVFYIRFGDECMKQFLYDTIRVQVRQPIEFVQRGDTSICEGHSATLSVLPSGGTGRYWFEVSDGYTVLGTSRFDYKLEDLLPGEHTYWVKFNDKCTESSDTAYFSVKVRDSLHLKLRSDTTLCYGTNVDVTSEVIGGLGTYQYNWGRGWTSNRILNVSPMEDTTLYLQVRDGCSLYAPLDSVNVFVRDSLQIAIKGPDTACYGETLQFVAVASGGVPSGYDLDWNSGDGYKAAFSKEFHSNEVLTLMLSDGCTPKSPIAQHKVLVRERLKIQMPNEEDICIGDSIQLEASLSGGVKTNYNVLWNNGVGQGALQTLSPQLTAQYAIILSDGCSDSDTAYYKLTVNPLPFVDFSMSDVPNCTGVDVNFTNKTPGGNSNTYSWLLGDGTTTNTESPVHSYPVSGSYSPKLIVLDANGCVDSLEKQNAVVILEHPVADFRYTPTELHYLQKTAGFDNMSSNANRYSWRFGDGAESDSTNPVHVYWDTGRYVVNLRAENEIGCWDEHADTLFINDAVVLYIPNAFTPNHDGLNDEFSPVVRGMASYTMYVYNQFGVVVWEYSSTRPTWDGRFKDERVPLDTYFYIFDGIDQNGGLVHREGRVEVLY